MMGALANPSQTYQMSCAIWGEIELVMCNSDSGIGVGIGILRISTVCGIGKELKACIFKDGIGRIWSRVVIELKSTFAGIAHH